MLIYNGTVSPIHQEVESSCLSSSGIWAGYTAPLWLPRLVETEPVSLRTLALDETTHPLKKSNYPETTMLEGPVPAYPVSQPSPPSCQTQWNHLEEDPVLPDAPVTRHSSHPWLWPHTSGSRDKPLGPLWIPEAQKTWAQWNNCYFTLLTFAVVCFPALTVPLTENLVTYKNPWSLPKYVGITFATLQVYCDIGNTQRVWPIQGVTER